MLVATVMTETVASTKAARTMTMTSKTTAKMKTTTNTTKRTVAAEPLPGRRATY